MKRMRLSMVLVAFALAGGCEKSGAKKPSPAPAAPAGGAANNLEAAPLVAVKTGPARIQMAEIVKAIDIFRITNNKLPDTLDEACRPGQVPKDPWGTTYFYRVENDKPIVWSAGPDRVSGTADDVK